MSNAEPMVVETTPCLLDSVYELLDVLEQLPRDVLRDNLWLHLAEPDSSSVPLRPFNGLHHPLLVGRAFRLACHRALRLADQLSWRASLPCAVDEETVDKNVQAVVHTHGAFLSRQEGLQLLMLEDVHQHSCDQVIPPTLRLGGATCQRLQVLHVDVIGPCTAAVAEAIRECCPNLRELALKVRQLEAAFFAPLCGCQSLTKLTVARMGDDFDCSAAVRVLGTLPALRFLTVGGQMGAEDLPHLAALTAVEELCLDDLIVYAGVEEAAHMGRLFGGMTQLTKFECPLWATGGNDGEFNNIVAAQLGGLTQLASLCFGRHAQDRPPFLGLRDSFAPLRRLSALTHLACLAIAPQEDASVGHLPLLRRLQIFTPLSPNGLAATLRPLLPLPELREFIATVQLDRDDDLGGDLPDADGRAAAAMWAAATLLSQAPRLERVSLTLTVSEEELPFSMGIATALLMPLLDNLVRLHLWYLPEGCVEVWWPLLSRAPRLQTLEVMGYCLSEAALLCLGRHLPALHNLKVQEWAEGTGDEVSGECAVALAAVRVTPLRVSWKPLLSADQYRRFREVARPGVTVGVYAIEEETGELQHYPSM